MFVILWINKLILNGIFSGNQGEEVTKVQEKEKKYIQTFLLLILRALEALLLRLL